MKISEIFRSLQGEGLLAGVPSVFVRIAGCPLRCRWCDTKYAWDPQTGTDYPVELIARRIEDLGCGHVVLTGGEPMTEKKLPDLAQAARALRRHVTIETAGFEFIPDLACDLMSISPKLSSSHDHPTAGRRKRLDLEVLSALIENYEYQLKFVVDSEDDITEIRGILDAVGPPHPNRVMLMPQAVTREEYISKAPLVACLCRDLGFVFSPRLQVLLWDGRRGH